MACQVCVGITMNEVLSLGPDWGDLIWCRAATSYAQHVLGWPENSDSRINNACGVINNVTVHLVGNQSVHARRMVSLKRYCSDDIVAVMMVMMIITSHLTGVNRRPLSPHLSAPLGTTTVLCFPRGAQWGTRGNKRRQHSASRPSNM